MTVNQENRTPWAPLALLVVAQFMVVLDIAIVNVALPSIGAALGFADSALQWVVTAYVLASGGLLLVGGRAADRYGRRRVFLAGLGVFTAASLLCGLAPSPAVLIGARVAQGVGAAMLTPAALSIITATYDGAQRATALSIWGAIASGGVAVGVLLGGVLTTWLSWRWIFLVNVPVGLAAAALTPRLVPAFATTRGSLGLRRGLTAVAGVTVLVYALSEREWWLVAIAAVLLAGYVRTERSGALTNRTLVSGTVMMLGVTGILAGTFFLNSMYLQADLGWSALRSGLAFLPFVAAITAGVHATSHAIGRIGSRALLVSGLLLAAAGAAGLALAPDQAHYVSDLLPGFVILGLGMGIAFPAISITAMSDVAHDTAGVASGLLSTAHEIGAALGVAALSAVALAAPPFDYGSASLAAAIVAGALALLAAIVMPAVRPAPGAHAAMH
jgi:MFS family permease